MILEFGEIINCCEAGQGTFMGRREQRKVNLIDIVRLCSYQEYMHKIDIVVFDG